jgi:hypothetical protein
MEPLSEECILDVKCIEKDDIYQSLFQAMNDPHLDALTVMALELLTSHMLLLLEGPFYCIPTTRG